MASTSAARKANGEPAAKTKSADTGTKVAIRRLAPGMTEDEFWSILGQDWRPGGDNVNWARFDKGKVAKDPLRYSRPAECYLHIIKQEDIANLTQAVQDTVWHDARNTYNDACLIGPPCVEIALYQKVPGAGRIDPRAGTIDLEPSFQTFLNNLANPQPASKENPSEKPAYDEAKKDSVKVTSTHLTEFIKEKAEKAKAAAASAKSAKHARQESQGTKGKGSEDSKKKGKDVKSDKTADKDKPKEPIRLLTKKAATQEAAEAAKSVADQIAAAKASEETPAAPAASKSRRAAVAAAAKLLQRDLGLSPGSAHRRARQDAAKAEAQAKAESNTTFDNKDAKDSRETKDAKDSKDSDKSVPTGPKAQASEGSRRSRGNKVKADAKGKSVDTAAASKPTTGPIILLRKEPSKQVDAASSAAGPSTTTHTPTPTPPTGPKASARKEATAANSAKTNAASQQKKSTTQPTPGATRAFVKHANPSQGVTDALLKQAMEVYGNVTFVEIDKRKGFAYVDFGDHQSLCKAIAASPVAVGSGTVQVLERKDKKPSASAAASSSNSTPAPAAATTPASAASSDTATADRPRRGGRGRGRRGGGGGNGNGNANANATSEAPAA